ncbi:hypothetical protein MPER_00695, partial [Moniliophthora perniciosa FA553]
REDSSGHQTCIGVIRAGAGMNVFRSHSRSRKWQLQPSQQLEGANSTQTLRAHSDIQPCGADVLVCIPLYDFDFGGRSHKRLPTIPSNEAF